ncbi:MAG: TetR/AcrR family transcriptional regulator [Bifidobacterium tibiigranuli]|uniref:TetR/AcrR family transcriptional regulator n=1 Tax=Bifidobacterium tibiigranuli TaxID=2172043 RepID=UPI002357393C|nr:TetR/AcrR family transcriptional regulator [Bifidobacterium tibiigranuli]MCH3974214.1 TetR/AcrR family transcriptional regulator [Bifidobacterium tibiigranuli]MCH4188777.1 TetR/AcrR family transcriptional regulator [Bifidobacterium tibiigranuli]MCH4203318.1 TetR/AcrR family transcriptional regulator [Bifidobacterium tibiigranuli]MCH4273551.1 TetR/AcrR family transcriptional regulator [Bifidobacterium tibiigranuli]
MQVCAIKEGGRMGYSGRKQQEQEIRKRDIVDAAERVFSRKGFENASMDELAKEAEFSKRTVYTYFSSKEQIYCEIMIRGYRLLIGMIEGSRHARPPQNAADELHAIFLAFFEFSRSRPDYCTAIMEYETTDSASQSRMQDESKAECYRLGEVIFGYLSRALRKGVAEGTLRGGLDTEQAAVLLWACTIGIYATGKKKADYLKHYHGIESDEFISQSFRLMMRLIGVNGEEPDEEGV